MKEMPRSRDIRKFVKVAALVGLAVALAASAGCVNGNAALPDGRDNAGQGTNGSTYGQAGVHDGQMKPGMRIRSREDINDAGSRNGGKDGKGEKGGKDAVLQLVERDGELLVPVRKLAHLLAFKTDQDPETGMLRIGDNDVAFELKAGSKEAMRDGEPLRLDKPAIDVNGELHAPVQVIKAIFADAFEYEVDGRSLRIREQEQRGHDANLPDFQDDPYDPYTNRGRADESAGHSPDIPVATNMKNVDVNALIRTAHNYIGVPYVFGAKPYPQSKVFDCSSYVQYVYGKYGVELPRASRKQATVGKAVSRTNLRKGDLLFFNLPGRYKSNNIVGHVGIYIGNGKMIHSSNKPKDGVQVTSINKTFWKDNYLRARRVIR